MHVMDPTHDSCHVSLMCRLLVIHAGIDNVCVRLHLDGTVYMPLISFFSLSNSLLEYSSLRLSSSPSLSPLKDTLNQVRALSEWYLNN